jgi:hypothetical protein
MVFGNRITDAEGAEIATTQAAESAVSGLTRPAELKHVIDQLPEQSQRVLHSYWLMVKDGAPCRPGDTLESIYSAIQARIAGEIEDDLARYLANLFPDKFLKFDSWRKTLKRIEKRYAAQPDLIAVLRRIGLCRR